MGGTKQGLGGGLLAGVSVMHRRRGLSTDLDVTGSRMGAERLRGRVLGGGSSRQRWGWEVAGVRTEVKTSVVCWMVAILVQPHFLKSWTRVGLCRVAEGWVRKKVGKRWRLERAGELEP